MKIRELARDNNVPIPEAPWLAGRSTPTELDQMIPRGLYTTVAEADGLGHAALNTGVRPRAACRRRSRPAERRRRAWTRGGGEGGGPYPPPLRGPVTMAEDLWSGFKSLSATQRMRE